MPLHAQFVRRSVPYHQVCDNCNDDDDDGDDDDDDYNDDDDDGDDDFSPSISSIASLQLP